MAKSAPIVLLMVFLTLTATFSPLSHNSTTAAAQSELQAATASTLDPNGTNDAFNVTFTHFDLYTRVNTTDPSPTPPGSIAWSSSFNNSIGSQIPDTSFRYELPAGTSLIEEINYTLNIPRGVSSRTFVTFKWNGTLGKGTNATYQLYNGTFLIFPAASVMKQGNQTFSGGPPVNATGVGHPFSCTATEECFDVSGFIGFNLTLRFAFGSNSSGIIAVRVANVIVASVQPNFTKATSHTMELKTSNQVEHRGNLTLAYNATVTYPKPNTNPVQNITHTWRQMLTTFFLPSSYTLESIAQNVTQTLYPGSVAMGQGACTMPFCTNSTFISLNMTRTVSITSVAEIVARSPNAVTNLQPMLGSIPTVFWMPGDAVSVKMTSSPGFNVSGSQSVNFTDPNRVIAVSQRINNRGGSYVYNLTLPERVSLGLWNITVSFLSGYDFGFLARIIRVEQVNTSPLTMTGEAGQGKTLTVQGTLTYGNSSVAGGVNATVFAVDTGSPPGSVLSQYLGSPLPGLYVSNITLANGVFDENQPLRVLFTVVNPTLSTAFSANVTIQHEWYVGQGGSHGANVTFPLTLGDEPFNLSPSSTYQMDVSLTSDGVIASVKSLTRTSVTVAHTLTPGSSAVSPFRQHFGLFNIAVTSKPFAGGTPNTNFLRSPTYAYVMTGSSVTPSRLLESSPTVMSLPSGSFTATLLADRLLGAKRLVLFVLARDVNGVVTGLGQVMTVSDSTILTATANIPAELTIRQPVTVSLSLRSSSIALPITLTVNLDVSDSTAFGTKTVTIQPGSTVPIDFTITAPDAAGSYLLTFSSPQYGVIATKDVKVGLLQSSLQVLIPAIIGLVSALVILGFYLVRKRGAVEIEEEEKKRPAPSKPSKPTQGPSGSKSLTRS